MKNSNRLSNIDLIKIFAIFIIIISHIIPFNYANFGDEYININFATDELVQIVIQFFRYLGQIGNTIFIISSSWFLLEKTTINKKKVIYILLDCWFISILILIIFIFRKYNLNFKIIIKNLLPTTFGNNWFIANYLIFYLIAPFLNKIINNCEKKELEKICIFLIIFDLWQFIKENKWLWSYLFGFIIIYFLIALKKRYYKEYNKIKNFRRLVIYLVLLVIFIVIINFIGLKCDFAKDKMQYFVNIKNPIIYMISISIFNIFLNIEIKNNIIVNIISSQTLLIYVIHDNLLIREFLRSKWFKYVYNMFGYEYIILICTISAICTLILSIIISYIYQKSIQPILHKFVDKMYGYIEKYISKFEKEEMYEK